VARIGARGEGVSVYFRDPDGSLLEFYSGAANQATEARVGPAFRNVTRTDSGSGLGDRASLRAHRGLDIGLAALCHCDGRPVRGSPPPPSLGASGRL
jgi:hypothetical protein